MSKLHVFSDVTLSHVPFVVFYLEPHLYGASKMFFSLVYSTMHNLALFSVDFTCHRPSMNFSRVWSFIVSGDTHMSMYTHKSRLADGLEHFSIYWDN